MRCYVAYEQLQTIYVRFTPIHMLKRYAYWDETHDIKYSLENIRTLSKLCPKMSKDMSMEVSLAN